MDHIDCDKCGKRISPVFDNPEHNCNCSSPDNWITLEIEDLKKRVKKLEMKTVF